MDKKKDLMTIGEASKYLRISKDTLRRWEKNKIIKPYRSPTGWRYYDKKQLDYVYNQKPDFQQATAKRKEPAKPTSPPTKSKPKVKEYNYKYIYLPFVLIVIVNIILIMIYMLISP
ncbi:MerR family DNA-binding transcriptional regulator [Patescibacteria group bacterium]